MPTKTRRSSGVEAVAASRRAIAQREKEDREREAVRIASVDDRLHRISMLTAALRNWDQYMTLAKVPPDDEEHGLEVSIGKIECTSDGNMVQPNGTVVVDRLTGMQILLAVDNIIRHELLGLGVHPEIAVAQEPRR